MAVCAFGDLLVYCATIHTVVHVFQSILTGQLNVLRSECGAADKELQKVRKHIKNVLQKIKL